jgi:DNA end-binding protein Ku
MPRSIWNGAISFGLIAVPVKVHSATEDKSIHFHQVHAKDGARIQLKRLCSEEGKEVPYKQIAKGYEVRDGEYVLLTKDEINAAAGQRSRVIDLEEFVRSEEVDPVVYDRTYYLGAGAKGDDAYRLLHDALSRCGRAGIGRWVFHNREYLVAVRPLKGVLALHTMRFADELVDASDLDIPAPSRAPARQEIEMAGQLVDALQATFRPTSFKDSYRERVLDLIARKAKGEELDLKAPEPAQSTPDLLAALEASLGKHKKGSPKGNGGASRSKQTARGSDRSKQNARGSDRSKQKARS